MTKKDSGFIIAGKKIYKICGGCNQLVCLNKWPFGSLHICAGGGKWMILRD
jgi:hypothetical protein